MKCYKLTFGYSATGELPISRNYGYFNAETKEEAFRMAIEKHEPEAMLDEDLYRWLKCFTSIKEVILYNGVEFIEN